MVHPIYQVDSFTATPFAGNPAGVCLLSQEQPAEWMQNVAREMNLSETAFILPEGDGYRLRWFTPLVEVDLCGHATLASAHILWETGALSPTSEARFQSRSGLLTAALRDGWIELNFPAQPVTHPVPADELVKALGAHACAASSNGIDVLVEVETEAEVRSMKPNFPALKSLGFRGVIVTSKASTPGFDFVSRFFAPVVGIDEDPVTGSSHTCLAPYWSTRLGKNELSAYQASARGGVLRVQLADDRVVIAGKAVTVIRGELAG